MNAKTVYPYPAGRIYGFDLNCCNQKEGRYVFVLSQAKYTPAVLLLKGRKWRINAFAELPDQI